MKKNEFNESVESVENDDVEKEEKIKPVKSDRIEEAKKKLRAKIVSLVKSGKSDNVHALKTALLNMGKK